MRIETIALKERPAPKADNGSPARFSALEWLAIATLAKAEPGRDEGLLDSLRNLYGQCENDPDRVRLDGLIGMAALIGAVGPDAFSRRLDKFLKVGFSVEHLRLLGDSLARQKRTALESPGSALM